MVFAFMKFNLTPINSTLFNAMSSMCKNFNECVIAMLGKGIFEQLVNYCFVPAILGTSFIWRRHCVLKPYCQCLSRCAAYGQIILLYSVSNNICILLWSLFNLE